MSVPLTQAESDKLYLKIEKLMVAQAVERARTLQAARKGPAPQQKANVQDLGKMHRWEVVNRPIGKDIAARLAETGILKPNGAAFEWKVVIDIPEKEWQIIQASARLPKFSELTDAIYAKAIAAASSKISRAEGDVAQIEGEPAWTADQINKAVDKRCDQLFKELSVLADESAAAAASRCDALLAAIHKENKDLNKWYATSFLKITGAVGGIVASATTIAGTMGAASPAAAFSLAKSILVLSQEIVRLSLDANQRYDYCKAELVLVQNLIKKAGAKGNTFTDVKELAFSVLGTVSGAEVPSVKSFKKHVEDYRQDITKIHQKLDKQGAELHKLLDEQTKFNNALRDLSLPKAKQATVLDSFDKVIESTMSQIDRCAVINKESDVAEERYLDLQEISEALSSSVSGWVKVVDPLIGAAFEVGMMFTGGPKVELPKMIEDAKKGLEYTKISLDTIKEELETAVELVGEKNKKK